jgi:hypothetical protein
MNSRMHLLSHLLFFLISKTIAQDFDPMANKNCPPYRCSKGQEPVPKWPLRLSSTGCSGIGGMQMFHVQSKTEDPNAICCHLRHACVQTCGSVKSLCDDEFLKCSQKICDSMKRPDDKKQCESTMGVHKMMVQMDPCHKFDANQYSRCECVPKSKAASKREQVLRSFYRKYNPKSIDKVEGLAKKADNPLKMAGLLMKLYQKFPDAIQKTKDPQQEMMEKLMNDPEAKAKAKETLAKEMKQEQDDGSSTVEDLGVDEL